MSTIVTTDTQHVRSWKSAAQMMALTIASAATLFVRVRMGLANSATGRIYLLTIALFIGTLGEAVISRFALAGSTRFRLRLAVFAAAALTTGAIRRSWGQIDATFMLIVAAGLSAAAILLMELVMATLRVQKRAELRLLAGVIVLMLLSTEGALRLFAGHLDSYGERNGGSYISQFTPARTWFHIYPAGMKVSIPKYEFTHERQANSLGLADAEVVMAKPPGQFRILTLGDSFTEGMGTDAESTWPKVAQRHLAERYPAREIAVLNGGASGSDPFFEYILLKEKLRPYHADLIAVAINTTDVDDIAVRGGLERFQPNGTVRFRVAPRWEPLFGMSYLVRLVTLDVLKYNWTLLRDRELAEARTAAGRELMTAVRALRALADEDGAQLLVIVHPFREDIRADTYINRAFADTVALLGKEPGIDFVDLLPGYAQDGTITKENVQQYFWPIDDHHNADGYRIMGTAIARHIVESGIVDTHGSASRSSVSLTSATSPVSASHLVAHTP